MRDSKLVRARDRVCTPMKGRRLVRAESKRGGGGKSKRGGDARDRLENALLAGRRSRPERDPILKPYGNVYGGLRGYPKSSPYDACCGNYGNYPYSFC